MSHINLIYVILSALLLIYLYFCPALGKLVLMAQSRCQTVKLNLKYINLTPTYSNCIKNIHLGKASFNVQASSNRFKLVQNGSNWLTIVLNSSHQTYLYIGQANENLFVYLTKNSNTLVWNPHLIFTQSPNRLVDHCETRLTLIT